MGRMEFPVSSLDISTHMTWGRRCAFVAVMMPFVLWQQMPYGGCFCSDGRFKPFCVAGIYKRTVPARLPVSELPTPRGSERKPSCCRAGGRFVATESDGS